MATRRLSSSAHIFRKPVPALSRSCFQPNYLLDKDSPTAKARGRLFGEFPTRPPHYQLSASDGQFCSRLLFDNRRIRRLTLSSFAEGHQGFRLSALLFSL